MRWRPPFALALALVASAAPAQDAIDLERARLAAAKAASRSAAVRAETLDAAAAQERDAAAKARGREAAVAARIARAEADIAAARARIAIVDGLLARQRGDLAAREAPVGRLLAALQSLARRPAVAAIVQPGSVDDLVHVRAVLGSALPVVRTRTAALRGALAETRRLRAQAAVAGESLRTGRVALVTERRALAALEAGHAGRATALGRDALAESDRAIALGEDARDSVDRMDAIVDERAALVALLRLPGPPTFDAAATAPPVYRLPVRGKLETGFGEISGSGVRSRGLTLMVRGGEGVFAPAAGRVVFARPFRRYGTVVILDHGKGWSSAVTGLARAAVAVGSVVGAGQGIGTAPATRSPRITVELRRRDRPVDIAGLIG